MTQVVRRTSTAEAIVEHLLSRIRQGEFGPGDRLPSERELQGEMGVGRLSLREGMARLSALGVIRVDHGKGAFVQERIDGQAIRGALTPMFADRNAKSLQDLVEARTLIEGELAALAAQKRTPADVERLQEILDRPEPARQHDAELADLDYAFHCEVARIADNDFLTVMLDAVGDHVRTFLLRYVRAHQDPDEVIDRHRPILEAIIRGDADQAREAARRHVHICKSSLESYVSGGAEPPGG